MAYRNVDRAKLLSLRANEERKNSQKKVSDLTEMYRYSAKQKPKPTNGASIGQRWDSDGT